MLPPIRVSYSTAQCGVPREWTRIFVSGTLGRRHAWSGARISIMNQDKGTGEILLIKLSEWQTRDSFAERLDALIDSGIVRIAMNLEDVALVNSTLLGLFVKTRNSARALGGDFVIVDPSPFVAKTLKSLGLDQVLTVVPDTAAAVRSLSG